ncbi:MAG: hypothetical protein IPL89_07080 [Acidobacteria bacterium]|nr:hypothetical protein [Acidobacteriota bacterium]
MWSSRRWSISARFEGVAARSAPEASLKSHAGFWSCQSSVWPRSVSPFDRAKFAIASASAKA